MAQRSVSRIHKGRLPLQDANEAAWIRKSFVPTVLPRRFTSYVSAKTQEKKLINKRQVARLFGVSMHTIDCWLHDGKLPEPKATFSKTAFSLIALLLVAVALVAGFVGLKLGVRYQIDAECCQLPLSRSLLVTAKEKLGLVTFYSQTGEDKWVSEAVFPGVKNGFFMDVGSGDGTFISNTKALEQKGWTGICIDPFPRNMQDRTCQTFKEVISNEAGKRVKFWAGGDWGRIIDESVEMKARMRTYTAPIVEFTTVTLADILNRAKAPRFIHYVRMDIEGGEVNALKGFPFDKYQIGALTVGAQLSGTQAQ